MIRPVLSVVALAVLAGCSIDPKAYESPPVTVQTRQGPVVCQLYTKEIVRWDRSITRPGAMSVEAADAVCLEAGRRWKES